MDEAAFQAALDANPDDHTTRLVFADWLQERDDPRAAGYREMGRIGFSPHCRLNAFLAADTVRRITGPGRMIWEAWNGDTRVVAIRDEKFYGGHTLPGLWLLFVNGEPFTMGGMVHSKDFLTRRECDDAVALAYPHYVAHLASLPAATPASAPAPA